MGKRGKNQKPNKHHRDRRIVRGGDEAQDDLLPSSAYDLPPPAEADVSEEGDYEELESDKEQDEGGVGAQEAGKIEQSDGLLKYHLYQKSVQSPKGDISYLQKFFLMYVGGRAPVHLQEDFCGTALLSTEWLRSDPRRTAVGLDLDLEALIWCLGNNLPMVGSDSHSRLSLFHGNVLQPLQAQLVESNPQELLESVKLDDQKRQVDVNYMESESAIGVPSITSTSEVPSMKTCKLPARDIICAFNYSCCCLQKRSELLLYFRNVLSSLSKKGGIFVMDLYGGSSSEKKLELRRRFPNFTYIWEQAEFDVINRKTRISLHFQLAKRQTLRHAFSYHWRLWSLPEIKDCLEEAGFKSVHVWIREMPDTCDVANIEEFNASKDAKYEDHLSFQQRDAWNAYIVGVPS